MAPDPPSPSVVFLSIRPKFINQIRSPLVCILLKTPIIACDSAEASGCSIASGLLPTASFASFYFCLDEIILHIMGDAEKNPTVADVSVSDESDTMSERQRSTNIPWSMKILSVVLVSLVGFGSHWSSGVTGAMKSTLKKVGSDQHVFLLLPIGTNKLVGAAHQ